MRSKILTALLATLLPLSAVAQDDMYFVPTKEQVKAEKEARQKEKQAQKEAQQKRQEALRQAYIKQNNATWKMEQVQIGNLENKENELANQKPTYYSGINKSVDEYNRRKTHSTAQCDTTVYSKDSIASDVIDFAQGSGYPDEVSRVDTVYKYVILDDDDYYYSRRMARWDNYYWWHNWGPWGWGRPIGWYAGWYGPWYDPFYDPWFDDPWFYGYGGWYGSYWAYDPWFYGYGWGGYYGGPWGGWYNGWYGPGVIGGYASYTHGFGPNNNAQRNDPHFYGNHSNHGYLAHSGSTPVSRSGSNYNVAQRNGGGTTINSGRTYNDRSTGWSHNTFRNSGSFSNNGGYSRSSSVSRSGGFSGGGSFSGGGGFSGGGHSGGGGFSGGGHSGGGGGGHR